MAAPLLEVKNLQVDFVSRKKSLTAVTGISFSLDRGVTLGVVGESGCGKSVTATAVMHLLPKQTSRVSKESQVLFNGTDTMAMSDKQFDEYRGRNISMIFQDPMTALNPVYKIGDQLVEMIRAHQSISKDEAWKKGVDMLDKMGIPNPEQRMKEYPHQLSGGMRQRVMIAMALSCSPQLLIADEPTTALDVTIQAQILELINKMKAEYNMAVMLITHDMGVIAEMADYVMVMYAGQVVEYAPVEKLFDAPLHPYTQGLLKSIPRLDQDTGELYSIDGTVPSLDAMPSGCRFASRCPYCTDACIHNEPELKEIEDGRSVRCFRCIKEESV